MLGPTNISKLSIGCFMVSCLLLFFASLSKCFYAMPPSLKMTKFFCDLVSHVIGEGHSDGQARQEFYYLTKRSQPAEVQRSPHFQSPSNMMVAPNQDPDKVTGIADPKVQK